MDDRALSRIGIAISVVWLLLCVFRIAFYSSFYLDTPQGRLFSAVLNILLVLGLLMVSYLVLVPMFRRIRAKRSGSSYCQQCYARIPEGEEFCPKCGWRKRSRPLPSAVLRAGPADGLSSAPCLHIIAHRTHLYARPAGPVSAPLELYMMLRAGIVVHLVRSISGSS